MIISSPWPHLIFDNFLGEDTLKEVRDTLDVGNYDFKIDYRGSGRIEYSVLKNKVLWTEIYSRRTLDVIKGAFGVKVKLNKKNLIQVRRMNGATPEFPMHHDYISGMNSIVGFLYLSRNWMPACGGRLLLGSDSDSGNIECAIEPLENRFVAFEAKENYWHMVEKVSQWERISVLSLWDVQA